MRLQSTVIGSLTMTAAARTALASRRRVRFYGLSAMYVNRRPGERADGAAARAAAPGVD